MRQLGACLIAATMNLLWCSDAAAQHYYGGGVAIPLNRVTHSLLWALLIDELVFTSHTHLLSNVRPQHHDSN